LNFVEQGVLKKKFIIFSAAAVISLRIHCNLIPGTGLSLLSNIFLSLKDKKEE
jgi:hypothetical protein